MLCSCTFLFVAKAWLAYIIMLGLMDAVRGVCLVRIFTAMWSTVCFFISVPSLFPLPPPGWSVWNWTGDVKVESLFLTTSYCYHVSSHSRQVQHPLQYFSSEVSKNHQMGTLWAGVDNSVGKGLAWQHPPFVSDFGIVESPPALLARVQLGNVLRLILTCRINTSRSVYLATSSVWFWHVESPPAGVYSSAGKGSAWQHPPFVSDFGIVETPPAGVL